MWNEDQDIVNQTNATDNTNLWLTADESNNVTNQRWSDNEDTADWSKFTNSENKNELTLRNGEDDLDLEDIDGDDDDDDADREAFEYHDLQLFFHAMEEPQLADYFVAHKVTLGQLLDFDDQDIINCGVDLVGDRKKILSSIAQLHCEKWTPSSLNDLTSRTFLTSPGIYIVTNDINKHLEYIGVTFAYMRRKIDANPKLLELGKDFVGIPKILSEIQDTLKTTRKTYNTLQSLARHMTKYTDDPNKKPAYHVQPDLMRSNTKKRIFQIVILSTVICVSVRLLVR